LVLGATAHDAFGVATTLNCERCGHAVVLLFDHAPSGEGAEAQSFATKGRRCLATLKIAGGRALKRQSRGAELWRDEYCFTEAAGDSSRELVPITPVLPA